jgi:hypothetical protein
MVRREVTIYMTEKSLNGNTAGSVSVLNSPVGRQISRRLPDLNRRLQVNLSWRFLQAYQKKQKTSRMPFAERTSIRGELWHGAHLALR